MSSHAATMSNSYPPTTRRRPVFFQKLAFTLLFVLSIAGFMALFNRYQKNLSSFWMTTFAVLSIGLAAGSVSRIIFYQRSGYVRLFAILLDLPLGMFLLGVFTNWQMGIGPINFWVKGIIHPSELIQLGGAFLIAFICLEAWWKPNSKIEDLPNTRTSVNRREQAPAAASIQLAQMRSSQIHTRESLVFPPKRNSRPKVVKTNKTRSGSIAAVDKLVLTHTGQPARSKHKRLSSKPMLKISSVEEHRCPFCLEEVKLNDPRGTKECEVCHSLHHADCWAITGMCQVPHLNS